MLLLLPASVWAARAGGIVFWLLAILGLVTLLAGRGRARSGDGDGDGDGDAAPPEPPHDRWLWAAALLPVGLNVASVLWFGLPAREISWWPFLAMPLVAAAAARIPDAAGRFVHGGLIACGVALAAAVWSRFVLNEEQPMFMMNPLPYGNLAFVATVTAAWAIAYRPKAGIGRYAAAAATVAGAAAFAASGIRGGLLALPLMVLAFLHLGDGRAIRARVPWARSLVVLAILGASLMILQPRNALVSKLERVSVEVDEYLKGHTAFSNVGERLAMWQASLELVRRHPLFGIGTHQFAKASADLREQGLYPEDAHIYRHAHSSYVTLAVEYGVMRPGVMAAALFCAIRALWSAHPRYRQLGLLLLGTWLLFGAANEILTHQVIIRGLVATVAIMAATRVARPQADR